MNVRKPIVLFMILFLNYRSVIYAAAAAPISVCPKIQQYILECPILDVLGTFSHCPKALNRHVKVVAV